MFVCVCVHVCSSYLKTKRQYEKSHRESEKALDAYRKSDADIHLSRADVEKVGVMLLFSSILQLRSTEALKRYHASSSHVEKCDAF